MDRPGGDGWARFGNRLGAQRHEEMEGAAGPASFAPMHLDRAFDPEPALHQMDELRGDRQSESGPSVLARDRAVGLRERLEDQRLFLGRDPDPGVGHAEMQLDGVRWPPPRSSTRSERPRLHRVNLMALLTRLTRSAGCGPDRPPPTTASAAACRARDPVCGSRTASVFIASPRCTAGSKVDRAPGPACPPRSWRSRECR